MNSINFFKGEYRFLSNFWPCVIVYEDRRYESVEHAYQAAKTVIPSERELFQQSMTPGQAKRLGRKVTMREDWDNVKISIMELLVQRKFEEPELREKLLATGTRELIEGNEWGDRFWGVCRGSGQNHLGKVLMRVRARAKG